MSITNDCFIVYYNPTYNNRGIINDILVYVNDIVLIVCANNQ